MWRLTFFLVACLAFASATQNTVFLIRHGEKPDDQGEGLSKLGKKRAKCLRNVFGASSQYNISYIIAETPDSVPDGKHSRPYDTVHPLSQDLGLQIDTSCEEEDAKCVADLVSNYSGTGHILICWEHHALTDIVAAMGNADAPTYPDDSFDLIWTNPYPYESIAKVSTEGCNLSESSVGGLDDDRQVPLRRLQN